MNNKRTNAVIVDENDVIINSVTGFRMIADMVNAEYYPSQSLNNSVFCKSEIGVMDKGKFRVFVFDSEFSGGKVWQLKQPRTYEELDRVREFVRKFNGLNQ